MSEESIIAESYSNLKSAILLGRTDIVRGILSTAAESKHVFIADVCSFYVQLLYLFIFDLLFFDITLSFFL
jgi:hypothetical protein